MFGFRIIKEWDYKKFLQLKNERDQLENQLREEIYQLSKDNGLLRDQLQKMIMDVNKDNSVTSLGDYSVIFKRAHRCDNCRYKDSKKCKKIEICVCNKSDEPSFR